MLGTGDYDIIRDEHAFELIEETRESIEHFPDARDPIGSGIDPAAAETHVVAHHPRTSEGLKQVQDLLALAEGIHKWRAPRAHVVKEEAEQ